MLDEGASSSAVLKRVAGNDGVVRSVPAFRVAEGKSVPGLVAELLRIASGGDAFIIKTDSAGIRSFVVDGVEVPTDRHGRLRVHYAKQRPQLYVSTKDLLAGDVWRERPAGQFGLIGTSAVAHIGSTSVRAWWCSSVCI